MYRLTRKKNTTRMLSVWSICGILAAAAFAGCEGRPEPSGKKQGAKKPGEGRAAANSAHPEIRDFFDWHAYRQKYLDSGETKPDTEAFLAEKERELRERNSPKPVSDSLELAAFRWRMEGKHPGEGQEAEFTASWLFGKKGPIALKPGQAAVLVLRGECDKAHGKHVKTSPYGYPMLERTFALDPGIEEWPEGEYRLVTRRLKAASIPYNMSTVFSLTAGGKYAGRYGSRVELGWQADLGE